MAAKSTKSKLVLYFFVTKGFKMTIRRSWKAYRKIPIIRISKEMEVY